MSFNTLNVAPAGALLPEAALRGRFRARGPAEGRQLTSRDLEAGNAA